MAISLKDIARKAGISNVTVSLALRDNGRISPARREQIKALALEMGYRPDPLARAMRTHQSLTVGLLIADLQTGVANLKVDAIEQLLVDQGYQALLGFTGGDPGRLRKHIQSMVDRRVDGIIVYGGHGSSRDWENTHAALGDRQPPCVLADFQAVTSGSPRVEVDRAAGMAMLARHLLELKHRDIVFVTSPDSPASKWTGVTRAVRQWPRADRATARKMLLWPRGTASLPSNPGNDSFTSLSPYLEAGAKVGRQIAALSPHDRPTAVIAMSDVIAMAVIRGLCDGGLRVPEDISVCGFDGEDFARLIFRPSLTTVRQPRVELAEKVVSLLLETMKGGTPASKVNLLQPSLIIGQSTGPVAGRPRRKLSTNTGN